MSAALQRLAMDDHCRHAAPCIRSILISTRGMIPAETGSVWIENDSPDYTQAARVAIHGRFMRLTAGGHAAPPYCAHECELVNANFPPATGSIRADARN